MLLIIWFNDKAATTDKNIELDLEEVRKWPKEGISDVFNVAVEHGNVKVTIAEVLMLARRKLTALLLAQYFRSV